MKENTGLTIDEELELLKLEKEANKNRRRRLELESSEENIVKVYPGSQWIPTPLDKEDMEEYEHKREVAGAYFRTESPLTNWIYTGGRKAIHWIEGMFAEEETEPFDLGAKLEQDQVPEHDRELFAGVDSLRDYEYVKEGIEQERKDESILENADWTDFIGPVILDFALFGGAGKVAGAVGKATKIAKGMTLTDGINRILSPLKPAVLKEIVKASGLGAIFAAADYTARYDVNAEEAVKRAGVYALVGGAFAGVMHGGGALIRKISDEIMERAYAKNAKKLILDEMKKEWELSSKDSGDKIVEFFASKSPLSKSHPYMMLFSKNEKVSRMARKLFVFNEEWVPGAFSKSMEGRVDFANGKDAKDFVKSLSTLNKINKEVTKYDGTTSREWFARAFYGGEESLPIDLPHREKIAGIVNTLEKKMESVSKLRREVTGEVPEMEESFLPFEETGESFSIEKIVERQKNQIKGNKPRYLPRTWNRDAIIEHEDELRELIKQGLINQKAIELGKKASVKGLEKYAESDELKRAINKQVHTLTRVKNAGDRAFDVERRTIRVDDRALYRFFSKDPLAELYNFLRTERTELEFAKTLKDAGYNDWSHFKNDVMADFNKEADKLRGDAKKAFINESEKIAHVLEQVEEIVMHRFKSNDGFFSGRKTKVIMDSAANLMYSASLGSTFLNSISDIKGMIVRCGLGNVVRNLSGSLVDSVNNGLRAIAHLPKSEQREILEALCLGIEEAKLNSRLKLMPRQNDGIFYGATKATFGEKSVYYTGKVADSVYKISGAKWWEDVLRRTAAKLVLNDLQKDPKYATKIAEMLKNKEFSEDIEELVYHKVNKIVTKPKMADIPSFAQSPFGKLFYSMQSWSFANSSNYVYPLLKGKFKKGRIAVSVLTVVTAEMLNKYIRRLVQGRPYDFSNEEDVMQFEKDVLNQSLDSLAGTIGIHESALMAGFRSMKLQNTSKIFHDMAPVLGYGDYVCALIGNCLKLYNSDLSYWRARKALRAIPANNVWYLEGITNKIAEEISGERRPK